MKWIEPEIISINNEILKRFPQTHLLAEQLSLRQIDSVSDAEAFLNPSKYIQQSPYFFDDMEKIVYRIFQAIRSDEKIGIWGDFDVDGQTATALLTDGLTRLGAHVSFHVPVRSTESHGIKTEYLSKFLQEGIGLLITCDTGITEYEALDFAKNKGIDVIISDHHTPGDKLPFSYAIVNPHLLDNGHPLSYLAGVGAAFQIIRALFDKENKSHLCSDFYDLVALGTIADMAELKGENRFYSQMGLRLLNENTRPALEAIIDIAGLKNQIRSESLISFGLAPRLNAAGRLADANQNVSFLLSQDVEFIRSKANKLEEQNRKRKILVDAVLSSCLNILEKQKELLQHPIIVLEGKNWEKGVIGITASRLVEIFHKPVILISADGEMGSGSARSIEGINIIQAIKQNQELLRKFGGHSMAAGVSINTQNISQFRTAIAHTIQSFSKGCDFEKQIKIDGYFDFENLTTSLLEEINLLSPFGQGNNPPVLVTKNLTIESEFRFGKTDAHRNITLENLKDETRESIWWNSTDMQVPEGRFDLAYFLRLKRYSGKESMVLEWIDCRQSEVNELKIQSDSLKVKIQDYRSTTNNIRIINHINEKKDAIVWSEGGFKKEKLNKKNRLELEEKPILVILSPPPDAKTLIKVLHKVRPEEIFLFSEDNPDDTFQGFLKNLSGLINFCIKKKKGITKINLLAAALGHSDDTVLTGLVWWKTHGDIDYFIDSDNVIFKKNIIEQNKTQLISISKELQAKLTETAAFRSYYLRADPNHLIDLYF